MRFELRRWFIIKKIKFIFCMLLTLLILGCRFNVQLNKPSPNKINSETESIKQPLKKESLTEKQKLENKPLDFQYKFLLKKEAAQIPIKPENNPKLPWNTNPAFLQAQINNNTPKLIAYYHIDLPEPYLAERTNIALAANKLKGAVIMPRQVFSLNQRIGKRTAPLGFKMGPSIKYKKKSKTIGGGVCKIATVMYNAAVLANQKIVERHPHTKKSPYIREGQDATLSYGALDFKFQNVTASPILIWAQSVGDDLYIALYGDYTPPKITWKHQVIKKTSRIKKVHSWIIINNGKQITTKNMGISKYYRKK